MWILLCPKHYLKHFTFTNSFNPHYSLEVGSIITLSFHMMKLRHREVGNLPEIAQLMSHPRAGHILYSFWAGHVHS